MGVHRKFLQRNGISRLGDLHIYIIKSVFEKGLKGILHVFMDDRYSTFAIDQLLPPPPHLPKLPTSAPAHLSKLPVSAPGQCTAPFGTRAKPLLAVPDRTFVWVVLDCYQHDTLGLHMLRRRGPELPGFAHAYLPVQLRTSIDIYLLVDALRRTQMELFTKPPRALPREYCEGDYLPGHNLFLGPVHVYLLDAAGSNGDEHSAAHRVHSKVVDLMGEYWEKHCRPDGERKSPSPSMAIPSSWSTRNSNSNNVDASTMCPNCWTHI